VQTEISKYLDSKVHNVRSSAKLVEGKANTYKTIVLSYPDKSVVVWWLLLTNLYNLYLPWIKTAVQ
jgi:hypothetical protein